MNWIGAVLLRPLGIIRKSLAATAVAGSVASVTSNRSAPCSMDSSLEPKVSQ